MRSWKATGNVGYSGEVGSSSSDSFKSGVQKSRSTINQNRWRAVGILVCSVITLWGIFALFPEYIRFHREANNNRFKMELQQAGILVH